MTNEFLTSITAGIIGGIAAALVFELVRFIYHAIYNQVIYKKYEGKYELYEKGKEPETTEPKFRFKIRLRGPRRNELYLKGNAENGSEIRGKIIFDRNLRLMGNGYYRHIPLKDGWGFIKMQLGEAGEDGEVLSIHSFANSSNGFEDSYVWKRVEC